MIVFFDGLDTSAITFVAPTLARDWGLGPAAMTPAFLATSLGAIARYVVSGPLSRRLGLRIVAGGSVALFAVIESGDSVQKRAPRLVTTPAHPLPTVAVLADCQRRSEGVNAEPAGAARTGHWIYGRDWP